MSKAVRLELNEAQRMDLEREYSSLTTLIMQLNFDYLLIMFLGYTRRFNHFFWTLYVEKEVIRPCRLKREKFGLKRERVYA